MKNENAVNRQDRTTIRTDMATRERIKRLAQQNGMTQEKFLEWLVDQAEIGIPESADQHTQSAERYTQSVDRHTQSEGRYTAAAYPKASAEYNGPQSTDVNYYDLLTEIKAVKKVVYRMIRELCRITDEDVADPDSGITEQTMYDDRLQHREKYGGQYY